MIFRIKNALRTLKASFGFKNKNMKPSKKNDVLIKKKCILSWYVGTGCYARYDSHILGEMVDHFNGYAITIVKTI